MPNPSIVENGEPETPALPDDCNFPLRDIDPFSKVGNQNDIYFKN